MSRKPLGVLRGSQLAANGADPELAATKAYLTALRTRGVVCVVCGRVFGEASVRLGGVGLCEEEKDDETWYGLPCSEFCRARILRRGWMLDLDDSRGAEKTES